MCLRYEIHQSCYWGHEVYEEINLFLMKQNNQILEVKSSI